MSPLQHRIAPLLIVLAIMSIVAAAKDTSAEEGTVPEELTQEQAAKLVNPVVYTRASINRGKLLFQQNCASCHDNDGKARSSVVARAADLTDPASWPYGSSDGEIFRSVRDGTASNMPPFKYVLNSDRDIWDMVNFVHSLRPNARPIVEGAQK